VTLGIRPRAFTPVGTRSKETIIATAELIEPMGAETLVHARTPDNSDIRVVVPRDVKFKIGDHLHLRADPAQTHVFGEDGKAVRA
jgi:ABC-type sugar transport system ATPase subunit